MNKKYILGIYDDEDVLLDAIEHIRAAGTKIYDVFSPYPVHGLDDVLGIKRSRLPIAAFLFGICGMCFALWMMIWMMGFDWPMLIGGKPQIALPSFIPITFELTVLFSAFGMVWTFFIVERMIPTFRVNVFDKRATDDKFVMAIEVKEGETDMKALNDMLRSSGAVEVNEKEVVK